MMPDQAPVTLVQGLPMFGGALLLILGAITVGSGYGWGTWKTVFTDRARPDHRFHRHPAARSASCSRA